MATQACTMNFDNTQASYGPRTPSVSLTPGDLFWKVKTVSADYKARKAVEDYKAKKAAEAEIKAAEKAAEMATWRARKAAEADTKAAEKAAEKAARIAKIRANRPSPPPGCPSLQPNFKKAKAAEIETSEIETSDPDVLPDDGWVLV